MASGGQPPTLPPSSERYIPGDATKKSSTTQEAEMQRKERSFQECIEFLMPVYLLPFLFGNKEGACIYCVLLTVAGLMGRLLPSPVAAMLPFVILPLAEVCSVDQLAADFLGPCVLSASLLFALAIIGDETTIFFRLCLYALKQYALRMQPLFVGMHSIVLGLSLILPSTLVVIFSTVFIDRFVTTVSNEILGTDQRNGVRLQTSSNYFDGGRRPRYGRKSSVSTFARRVRSVSVSDSGTLASEASGSSLVARPHRRQPSFSTFEGQGAPRGQLRAQRGPRKTSFAGLGRSPGGDDRPCHLPVRRIRSFSAEPKQPSSILKRNVPPAAPPPSRRTPTSTPPCPHPSPLESPAQAIAGTEDRRGTFPMGYFLTASAQGTPEQPDVHDETPVSTMRSALSSAITTASTPAAVTAIPSLSMTSPEASQLISAMQTAPSSAVTSSSTPAAVTAPPSMSMTSPEASHSAAADSSPAALASRVPRRYSAAVTATSPLLAKRSSSASRTSSSRKSRARASSRRSTDGEVDSSARMCEDHAETSQQFQSNSTSDVYQLMPLVGRSGASKEETKLEARRPGKPKQKGVPHPNPQAKVDPVPVPKSALKYDPRAEEKPEASTEQEPEQRPEVRSVLKRRNPSLQPSTGSRSGSVRSWFPFPQFENEEFNLDSRTTPRGFTGAEPQTSSLRVRALTMAARPAFIAGAAYTAIFGNVASLSTVPARNTVLVTLGCRDKDCPVNWWSWFLVSLPVALVCCIVCWTSIYCASLVSCDDDVDEQTHEDMSKSARVRHRNMKRHSVREALAFYWLMGIPVASSAYSAQHPGWRLEVPLLSLAVLVLSVAPGSLRRRCWSHRMLNWQSLCSRMPWSIILMLGSVMALSRTVEDYRLVELGLAKLDDQFWAQRSTKSSQFILVSVAAVLSELLVGESVARSMATTAVRVAVVTETPVSFYVVPVSLAASINVILPVSLPLIVMREYAHANSAQMVAYGVFIKCVAVTAIFLSMNTIGLVVFQGEQLPKQPAMGTLHNTTDIDSARL
ncbi:uncharacterized protein LOC144119679 [Amblyomma americanum]